MTKLDDTDRQILRELQADGRLTHVTLAARVGLSRSAVQERVARLEDEGVILGYTVRLGQPNAAAGLRAYLFVRGGPSHDRFAKTLEAYPEVKACDSVSGEIDLIVQLQVDRIEDLNRMRDEIGKLPGVVSTTTLVVMSPRFDRR